MISIIAVIIAQLSSTTLGPLSADWVLVGLGGILAFLLKRNLDRIDKMLDAQAEALKVLHTDVQVLKVQPRIESEKIAQEIMTKLKFLSNEGKGPNEEKHYKTY